MISIGEILHDMGWDRKLADLARRVEANVPCRHDPEVFHHEKSDIAGELRTMSRGVANGVIAVPSWDHRNEF